MMRRGVLVAGACLRPASIHHTRPFATTRHLLSNTKVDVLIIGSGAGSLTAALRAKHHNLRIAVIEKQPTIGGASAISGGGLWIPNNPVSNVKDSKQDALDYFDQAVGDVGPASSLARRHAYLDNAPKMIAFLQEKGFKFRPSDGYPDYYPKMKGAMGKGGGRTIESKAFNTKKLDKKWQDALPPPTTPVAIYTNQAPVIMRMTSSVNAFTQSVRAVLPSVLKMLIGQKPTSFGRALVAQLLYLNTHSSSPTDIRLSTSLTSLTTDSDGTVTGAKVKTPTGEETIAARSLILAAGGFAHNASLRKKHLPFPSTTTWTSSPKGDTGDAVMAGINLGAATALMDDAWWGPTIFDPVTGKPHFALIERSRPHCIIVDSAGKRFMNEAESYTDAGHDQYQRNEKVKAIPAWLVMDSNHRNRYMLGTGLFARQKPPKKAIEEGKMFMAGSLEELGSKIGVDVKGLKETVEKYNVMCERGVDEEFGKGDSAYDNFFGDPDAGGLNPNMGPLNRAPFYAIAIWPGDLGTKGGLLTDEHQRVLRENESIIPGLYAIGNTAASIMGRTYLGAGSTLGPAMTHGFVAVDHIASQKKP
ncbi:3-ketosteroid 1-dehydrogenase helE [Colletotrichum siamense]|uniref:3-ketosteroid 1-dehydrogenase helE n=1 Tax=Colletotrichum siamense TaxID=690259 RepID=A0A9P5EUL7_COLSI|nr:3-ketosteroid 1-dehydrogenase helE [Colletotrichum siamense]KAF4859712.1 3-ketosteroid 1-dehydrogenase helE [Colletotrichum siamense]